MSMIDKIRALRAKANDRASTEAEAELFAAKVQQLMEEHHITEAQLDERREEHVQREFVMRHACGWRRELASAVGRFCGAAFTWTPGTNRAQFTARPLIAEAAEELYQHLHKQVQVITRNRDYTSRQKVQAEKGAGLRLVVRLDEIRKQLPESRLPVVQEAAAAEEALHRMCPNIRSAKNDITIDTAEAAAGYRIGDAIRIQDATE